MKRLLALFLFFCIPAAAQTVVFKVEKPKEVRLAEKFDIVYELKYKGDFEIMISTEKLSDGDFQLLRIVKRGKNSFSLELIPFNIGISTFPSLAFSLTSGSASYKAKSPEITLDIKPFFEDKGDSKLIDIYPPFLFIDWLKLLLIAAALALLAWFVYRKLRKEQPGLIPARDAAPDNRTPYQKALDEITFLLQAGLLEKGEIKNFYISLSDIFRNYAEREFLIRANRMTTNDMAKSLKGTFRDIKDLIATREFLDGCDLVKFARHTPETAEINGDVEKLKHLINVLDAISSKKKSDAAAAAMKTSGQVGAKK